MLRRERCVRDQRAKEENARRIRNIPPYRRGFMRGKVFSLGDALQGTGGEMWATDAVAGVRAGEDGAR